MEMKFVLLLTLALFLFISANEVQGQDPFDIDCKTAFTDGGCPSVKACANRCKKCYQGHGEVYSRCAADRKCICLFSKGAPCPPLPGCALNPPAELLL